MDEQGSLKRISCSRCQSKKIRCNRADPRCDKCEIAGVDCIYLPRKHRSRKQNYASGLTDRDILFDILRRLDRLEDHCKLNPNDENLRHASGPMSISSVDSGSNGPRSASLEPLSHSKSHSPAAHEVTHSLVDWIRDPATRSELFSNAFCHLRNAESRFFGNEICLQAMGTAIAEVEYLDNTLINQLPDSPPVIPKDMARKCLQNYYDSFQFEGFRVPLDKNFLMSIPDLLEIPHVQLDYASRIIYYSLLVHGVMLDSEYDPTKGDIVPYVYRTCMELAEGWLAEIKNTPADLLASFVLTAMALEACKIELCWRIFGHSCTIARALGYFSVDGDPGEQEEQKIPIEKGPENETEVDRNKKRFEFWHLLRTDCHFRLSFGKPAVIQPGSWRVNFPDPTINGVDDASTHFVQIHFLASMRLTLALLKYLDFVDSVPDPDPPTFDSTVDGLIAEVNSIMSDWNAEELLKTANNLADTSFCADILFSSYRMLIVFDQAMKRNQNSQYLPRRTVEAARKSLQMFQSLMGSTAFAHWGISLILLHQFAPLFILSLHIIESHDLGDIEADLALVAWVSDFMERTVKKRVELRPATAMMRALALVCQQVKSGGH